MGTIKTIYHVGDTVRVTRLSRMDEKIGEIEVGGIYIVNQTFPSGSVYVSAGEVPEYTLVHNQVEKVEQEES